VYFVYLGIGTFFAAYLQVALWTLTGENPGLTAQRNKIKIDESGCCSFVLLPVDVHF
jgi:hypothetical protein